MAWQLAMLVDELVVVGQVARKHRRHELGRMKWAFQVGRAHNEHGVAGQMRLVEGVLGRLSASDQIFFETSSE